MRRNFAQILKSGKVDYKSEYKKLYQILFEEEYSTGVYYGTTGTLHDLFDTIFRNYWFAGTCLTLKEFDEKYGYAFPPPNGDIAFDDLVSLMEYFQNLLVGFHGACSYGASDILPVNSGFLIQHLHKVADAIGCEFSSQDGLNIVVEKNAVVTAVAESELIPKDFSYKLISYNHHSMRGNLEDKKAIILQLANLLEGKQAKLSRVNSSLKNDLFYLFNNFNIRHNNCDSQGKDYKPGIASMDKEELENWYDETYQMCLLAFMELEQADRKPKFDAIKAEIEMK